MSWLSDVFGSKDLDYPLGIVTSSGDPTKDAREGVLVRWFAPKLLPYPVPLAGDRDPRVVGTVPGVGAGMHVVLVEVPGPTAPAPGVSTMPATLAPAPVVVPVAAPVPMAAPAPMAASAPVAAPAPVGASQVQAQAAPPSAPILFALAGGPNIGRTFRAYSFNPEFAGPGVCASTLMGADGEELDLDLLALFTEWVTVDADPISFVVPDGCDAVDVSFGATEVTPGVGCDADLDLPIAATNQAQLSIPSGSGCSLDRLTPGDQILVTVPWRASAAISLPGGRLRQLIRADFFRRGDASIR